MLPGEPVATPQSVARKASPVNASPRDPSMHMGSASPSSDSDQSYRSLSPTRAAHHASVRGILSSIHVASSPQKKRRRDDDYTALKLLQQGKPTPARSGAPLTATHEIRHLRKEVAEMESHLQHLESKWNTTIPDLEQLTLACLAAKEKWTTAQVETVNAELKDQLTQQQFIFASLQSAILQAPLQAQCREMFDAIHFNTRLSQDEQQRVAELQAHCERGVATVPETVKRFTGHIASSPTPFSQTSITGGADSTFISNVFVLEMPHTSLLEVFQATLGYYAMLPKEMQRCVATKMEVKPLNLLSKLRQYAKVTFTNELFATSVNTTFAAKLQDDLAIIHSDGVVNDPLNPMPADESVSRIGVNAITLTPITDPESGKICKVVLRRVLVYRYNLLPHHPLVQRDMKLNQCVINGDLLTALMCQNLQQQKPHVIEQAGEGTYQYC